MAVEYKELRGRERRYFHNLSTQFDNVHLVIVLTLLQQTFTVRGRLVDLREIVVSCLNNEFLPE